MSITRYQAAGARAALGLKQAEVAAEAGVTWRTVTDFERGAREPIGATKAAIRSALESQGAVFTEDGGFTVTGAALAAHRRDGEVEE